jgi:hypothetical protein
VRFDRKAGPSTKILVVTEGMPPSSLKKGGRPPAFRLVEPLPNPRPAPPGRSVPRMRGRNDLRRDRGVQGGIAGAKGKAGPRGMIPFHGVVSTSRSASQPKLVPPGGA